MSTILAAILSWVGAAFLLIAGVGLLRMEDVYTRLHGASKAAPLGAVVILLALAIGSNQLEVTLRVLVISGFLLLTAPIAAHAIGRSAYLSRDALHGAQRDELRGRYDMETLTLRSSADEAQQVPPSVEEQRSR